MNIFIPATMGPDTAKHMASACTGLVKSPTSDVDASFFTLYFLSVSWNSMWRVKLKIALTELKTFLKTAPSSQDLESFIAQSAAFKTDHKISLAFLEKAQIFGSIVADDLVKNISKVSVENMLTHIDAVLQSSAEWQASFQDALKNLNLRECLEANAIPAAATQDSGIASSRRRTRVDAATGRAAPVVEEPVAKEGLSLEIFDINKVLALLEKQGGGGLMDQEAGKQKRLLVELAGSTGIRPLAQYTQNAIESLYARFPHFKPVLDFVTTSLAMAGCGESGTPSIIPPILLRGTPGTGKSYFAEELAKVLGTSFVRKDLSVTSEAFVISGLDTSWRGAKPGVVFDTLTAGKFANPVICLDEVDKVKQSGYNSSPIASLYALLEPATSAKFKDEFLPLELDASKINWILTANDGTIPEPVLSRLEVFDIPTPTKDECMAIAQSVWESVCKEVLPKGHGFAQQLPEDVKEFMGLLSPRIMRKALSFAVGCAAKEGRKVLEISDLSRSASRYAPKVKPTIGFMN